MLGIDIGSSSIKVVQVRNKMGQAILETYGEVALGPYAEVEIGRAVKLRGEQMVVATNDVLKESNSTTKIGGVSIPLSSSLITTMKVPRLNDNLEEMVAMEARRYIPVSLSEVTLDWQVIPSLPKVNSNVTASVRSGQPENASEVSELESDAQTVESTNVLIVAVHTETINQLKTMTDQVGLECRFFELEAFSTIRAVANRQIKTSVIVDFGAGSTKIYVIDQGVIRVSHVVSFGSQDLTLAIARSTGMPIAEAERLKRTEGIPDTLRGVNLSRLMEGSVSFLANEVDKVIRNYQSHDGSIVEEVVLSGGGVNVKGLPKLFVERAPVSVRVADPFANLMAPAFLQKILQDIGPSFSVAIGAALRAAGEGK